MPPSQAADIFGFYYEREFVLSRSLVSKADVTEAAIQHLDGILDDLLNIDDDFF